MISADVLSFALYDVDPRFDSNYLNLLPHMRSYSPTHGQVNLIFANTADESLLIWKGACLGVAQCKDGRKYHMAISYLGEHARVLETGQKIRFLGASAVEFERVKEAACREVFIPEGQRRSQPKGAEFADKLVLNPLHYSTHAGRATNPDVLLPKHDLPVNCLSAPRTAASQPRATAEEIAASVRPHRRSSEDIRKTAV